MATRFIQVFKEPDSASRILLKNYVKIKKNISKKANS